MKSKQVPLKKTLPLKFATNAIRSTPATRKSWIPKVELKDSKKDTNKSKFVFYLKKFKKEDFNFRVLFLSANFLLM